MAAQMPQVVRLVAFWAGPKAAELDEAALLAWMEDVLKW